MRTPLPDERNSITHTFLISAADGVYEGCITVGLYKDGRPGEVFIRLSGPRVDTNVSALMDCIGISVSFALQCGADLEALCSKYIGQRFEPSGPTNQPLIAGAASSPVDYVFRYIRCRFLPAPPTLALAELPSQ